jgi:hypothetical protein
MRLKTPKGIMRTGALSDTSVRAFCRTIERDTSHHPLTHRPLATRSGKREFGRRLAEAAFTSEQLANITPDMYRALFAHAAAVLRGEVAEEVDGEELEEELDEEELEEGEEEWEEGDDGEEGVESAEFRFQPLAPSTPTRETTPSSTASPPSKRSSLGFSPPQREKGDITRQRPLTRGAIRRMSRKELVEMYRRFHLERYGAEPDIEDGATDAELADEIINMV